MSVRSAVIILFILVMCGCGEVKNSTNENSQENLALKRFPGIDEEQILQLLWAKEQICLDRDIDDSTVKAIEINTGGKCRIPLPTWTPPGFAVERLFINVGKGVDQDSLKLTIVYSKKQANSRKQVFVIDAGFEFGGLPYGDHHVVKSAIGDIWLYYEPIDDTIYRDAARWGKPILKLVETEWFGAEKLCYPLYTYVSSANRFAEQGIVDTAHFEMIPLEETKRILASLEEL